MRRLVPPLVIPGCFLALIVTCYGAVLFGGEQFAYRDAAHYYYPLYRLVQAEWEAGRWPLWEPEENGGMPLLGNPTAAVLYPGKIIYALLPYAWGARLYIVAHTALAFVGMLALMRSWGTSWTGAALSGLAYAFGGPILFQYCNVIYLVGAAWLPLGFRAVDRWLRLGRRFGLLELAVVLAMQTLGGDPETAYLTGLCAGGYALGLVWLRSRPAAARPRLGRILVAAVALAVVWVVGTLELARRLPSWRPRHYPPLAFSWMDWVHPAILVVWGCVGLILLVRWRRKGGSVLVIMLAGLAGSAVLAAALSAAQLLPVLEFTGQSSRATLGGTHDIYPFSLEPVRLAELIWPNVFGTHFAGNRSWLEATPSAARRAWIWVPSLYLGGLTMVLALGAAGFRGGPPWRGWLTAVAVVSLVASLGEYTSPLWWARWVPSLAARVGPHDDPETTVIRLDGRLRDGDGSFYWMLATFVPGFRQFRFPSKLLTFTALALTALAGLGWDRLAEDQPGRTARRALVLLVLAVIALAVAESQRPRIIAAWTRVIPPRSSHFGPFEPAGTFRELRASLLQAMTVYLAGLVLVLKGRRVGWSGALALVIMTADLALANAQLVLTVPQRELDTEPKAVRLIEAAELAKPTPGGYYRVHRLPIWVPATWSRTPSPDRHRDFLTWERDTLQPKNGLPWGIQYTETLGVAELYDYEWFFGGFLRTIGPDVARQLDVKPGQQVVVFPRRGFDLWNTRYFLLPAVPNGWKDERRGYSSFLDQSEPVYPSPGAFEGPNGRELQETWVLREDFQILRNLAVYPRAWIVHEGRFLQPIVGLAREDRDLPMGEILFQNDRFWNDPTQPVYNPRHLAWFDSDRRAELFGYLSGVPPQPSESVTITSYGPQRVELDAVLEQPGVVILADVFYPGWRLTIDGIDAPIYRTNRMMRGAAVPPGRHHLVYTYQPRSFRRGGRITLAGLAVLIALGLWSSRRPVTFGLLPRESAVVE